MNRLPVVVLVGRPNVGKSSLFNRLLRRRQAIVADVPGITRDRLTAEAEWGGRRFILVDTGGLDAPPDGITQPKDPTRAVLTAEVEAAAQAQALAAVREADLVVFVVDGQAGLHPSDNEVADQLRRVGKPVLLTVNKADRRTVAEAASEFYALGLGDPLAVSAEHGVNVGELLDTIVDRLPPVVDGEGQDGQADPATLDNVTRVCIVGRPNVGKSSLLNRLIGEERAIVSPLPGTTRETVDARWEASGRVFELVDTAGMRRRARVDSDVEYYGVSRTLRAIELCDVALIVLDGSGPVTEQDKKIAGYVHEQGRAAILLVNKWDLAERDERATGRYVEMVRRELSFLPYAPILFVSALTGLRLHRLPEAIARVAANHATQVEKGKLNRLIEEAQALHAPPGRKGRHLRIYSVIQARVKPPTFLFLVNDPELLHYSYERYLENRLRQAFDLEGTPVRFRFRRRERGKG